MQQLQKQQIENLQRASLSPQQQELMRKEFQNQYELISRVYNIPIDQQNL